MAQAGPVDAEGYGKNVWGVAFPPESEWNYQRQTERVASDGEQRLAAGEAAGTSSRVPRAWVKPGADKANRRLPPERRSRAGLPGRDRGRRAKRNGDRSGAVAEGYVLM